MSENFSNSRNNHPKCEFNNSGFCKFRKECRKHHVEQVCEIQTCDHKCLNRRPKHWGKVKKCKFFNKNICAFGHDTLEKENDNDQNVEIILDELGKLKKKLSYDKENESKVINNQDPSCH